MRNNLEKFHEIQPYGLMQTEKEKLLGSRLNELTSCHYENCKEYHKILKTLEVNLDKTYEIEEIPFIPVRLFKNYELLSVSKDDIAKVMTSSGTSGQSVSKIYLSKENIRSQTKTLAQIISSFIGKKRLPLLILDTELVKKDRNMFSARGAGIIGFTTFGRDICYALDEKMQLDVDKVIGFIEKYKNETILMFGYTYMIWQYIVLELERLGISLKTKGILFHIGGWKKLKDQAVDTLAYNRRVCGCFGDVQVYNYYGMAEQLGSVFVECEHGHMHCSNYSDIIIRRAKDFSVADIKERGLIELVSALPISYPGHAILTEDEGEILGIDNCPCGRKGKYFKIYGRVKGAEIRGCSDTHERR